MTRFRKCLVGALIVVAGCKGEEPQKPAPPSVAAAAVVEAKKSDPLEDLASAAFSKWAALYYLRKEVSLDRAAWPSEEPELDFRKETGNAIVVHHESGRHDNPLEVLTRGAAFKLFHLEDDPYRLAQAAGSFTAKPEEKAKYRVDRYKPALEHMVRAKYAVYVVAKVQQPQVDSPSTRSFSPGKLEGAGVLYEIESKKLLGGFLLEARSSDKVNVRSGAYTGQGHDSVLHDFENNAREALWKALKARFPSARLPTIVYLDSKEE
jgi:hypothetical protein